MTVRERERLGEWEGGGGRGGSGKEIKGDKGWEREGRREVERGRE